MLVFGNELFDDGDGYHADGGILESCSFGDIVGIGQSGTVAEELVELGHAYNLLASTYTLLVDFHLAFQQAEQVAGSLVFMVDDVILPVSANRRVIRQ